MTTEPQWSEVDENHPMTKMMNGLVEGHREICAVAGISPWDFLTMLANVQGIVLSQSKDMPTGKAIERIDKLAEVSKLRLHEMRAPETTDTTN